MRTAKCYSHLTRRTLRTEVEECPTCHRRLRRSLIISRRTIVTLSEVIRLTHWGYRCPDGTCSGYGRLYRSAAASALALPGFTFGLDIVLLVGALRLGRHQTVDEVHQDLLTRLQPLGVSISRREILFLFETYSALVRAATEVTSDQDWKAQAQANGGLLLSIDGIQPDKGNETIYLVRDLLTGRLLAAENVTSSRTEVLKQLLAPIKALDLPVLGVISDAQDSQRQAIAALWPEAPHQICQFHALREASRPIYELDRTIRTQVRKQLQKKLSAFRIDAQQRLPQAPEAERQQLRVLEDYAAAVQTAVNVEGLAPFEYAGVRMDEALSSIEQSLEQVEKKGQQ
ncbi:MAG: hypothetical protein JOZ18_17395 [Chloroflexi bacterium]|nr:hypothetical protein [Chloroflexota bacterium]